MSALAAGLLKSVTGDALIGLGGNFLSGILGSSAQDKANQTNLRIAQMNNEFNERMLQKQMDYNTEMWNKQNDYNSLAAQRKRAEEAGYSPWSLMQGANAGSASSVGGINPPTATPVSVQPNTAMSTAIGQGVQQFIAQKMAKERHDAEIQQINIESQYRAQMAMVDAMDKIQDIRNKEVQNKLSHQLLKYQPTLWHTQIHLQNQQANAAASSAELNFAEKLLKDAELRTFDKRFNADMAMAAAQAAQYSAVANLSRKQAEHEVEKVLKTQAEVDGIKIDNDTRKRMADAIVDKAYNDEYWSRYSSNPWQMGQEVVQTKGRSYK